MSEPRQMDAFWETA